MSFANSNWKAARRKSTRNARKVMVGRGNWGEINKEVVRRERFDKEFASTISDAASAALGPNARKKKFGNSASSRSNPKRQRAQNNEMDTETFLAMWDREREQQQSTTLTRKKQTQEIEQLSPSGMAFHLQQGYQLQFAMGGSVLADSFSGVSPYERHDAVNVFNIGNVADKFFEPRPPPSARPRPPPNTANHRRGGGTAGPHNLSPRQKKYDANDSRTNRASSPRHKKYNANNPEEKQKWLEHQQQKYERHVNKKSRLRDRRRQKKQQNHNQEESSDVGDRRDRGERREERDGRNPNSYSSRNTRNSNIREEQLSTRQIKGEAATKVQSMFRGMHAREQYEDLLDQADASTLLQAHARGFAVRMEVSEMNVAAVKVQRLYRESATRKRKTRTTRNHRMGIDRYNDEHNNEYNTRAHGISRRPMNLREKKGRAAIKIQALERGRVARADVEMLEDEMDSAIAIQKHMRGKAVRLEIQEQHQSARSIQKHARGQLVRKGFKPDPHYQAPKKLGTPRPGAAIHTGKGQNWTSATPIGTHKGTKGTKGTKGQSRSSSASAPRSSHGHLHGTKEVNTAAIKVQSLYRGHMAREDVEDMREEADAASLIQAQIRGKGVRLEVMEMNRAAKVIQRHERGNQARDYVEEMREDDESSTMIQKHVRGAAVRMEISEMNNAGTLIQKNVRGQQARAKYGKTKGVGRQTSVDIEEPRKESKTEAEEEDSETEEETEEVEVLEQEGTEEPAATLVRCVAIHDFDSTGEGEEADDLPFDTGTIIIATDTSEDWWCGYREEEGPSGKHGYFPHNYVEVAEDG